MVEDEEGWRVTPDERAVAAFRDGQLTLTNHRVVYRGRGLARHESAAVRLEDVTGTGIVRRFFRWRLLGVPLLVFALGFFFAFVVEDEGPFILGMLFALVTTPLPFFDNRHYVAVATPGFVVHAAVPVRHVQAAREFLEQVEEARRTRASARSLEDEIAAPTTRPYR